MPTTASPHPAHHDLDDHPAARMDRWVREHPRPWRLLRRSLWRGRLQGALLVLLAVFFTRWLLTAMLLVGIGYGIARLVWWLRRGRHGEPWRWGWRSRWRQRQRHERPVVDYTPHHAAAPQSQERREEEANALLRTALSLDATDALIASRLEEHQRAVTDFDRRLVRALEDAASPEPVPSHVASS